VRLSQLKRHQTATIAAIVQTSPAIPDATSQHSITDAIARRLITLGFVPGEQVRVLEKGLFGGDPILVQIGFTRFALRRTEAARIEVSHIEDKQ
jgi:ferrous iron transport protein A